MTRLKRFTVTFTRETEVSVLAPDDATEEEIAALAQGLNPDEWDHEDWGDLEGVRVVNGVVE